ncbi:hypothetical protein EW145_g3774 [Phellinidium pouzarii]|uniref:Methyltransferase n=1 Tax=Phellinidium pouzarii TaxID=167371 RepID=A0A4S4L5W4_9AGAM|nr:hypothetical protein EW145_g3774 [Phellinidium pouzarii]
MTSSANPAVEMQDAVSKAISSLLKAANHAFTSVEEASKVELKRAMQIERDAQRERDELRRNEFIREREALLLEKMNVAVELESLKSEAERWKAATEKGEWMINHQAETIAQLRREAQQWKDQFMRVDEERLRLSARNDELVSQQLSANRRDNYHQEPLTPHSQGPQALSSSSASISTRATSSNQYMSNGYVTDSNIASRRTSRNYLSASQVQAQAVRAESSRRASGNGKPQLTPSTSSNSNASTSRPTQPSTKSTFIRRVHVVMERKPVKEESVDSVPLPAPDKDASARSASIDEDEEIVPPELAVTKRKAAAQGQGNGGRRTWSEDKRIYDESDESRSESDGDRDEDEDEDEDDYVPPKTTSRADDEDDEDEDELMLGGEDNRNEIYGSEKVVIKGIRNPPARRAQTQPAKQNSIPSGKKRNTFLLTMATAELLTPHDVPTILNYYTPVGEETPFQYVQEPPEGTPKHNLGNEPHPVVVHDIRGKEDTIGLDKTGFQFVQSPSAESDFLDDERIRNVYYKEVEDLLKREVGAKRVVIFDHTIRRNYDNASADNKNLRSPVERVHIDQTFDASVARVHRHLGEDAERLLKGRVRIINVWRPIGNPVAHKPLAVADWRTLNVEHDLVPVRFIYPDRVGATFSVKYNPELQWYYLSGQRPDEVTLIKCFDSDETKARLTPHSAFLDTSSPENAPKRQSIEVRTLVFDTE